MQSLQFPNSARPSGDGKVATPSPSFLSSGISKPGLEVARRPLVGLRDVPVLCVPASRSSPWWWHGGAALSGQITALGYSAMLLPACSWGQPKQPKLASHTWLLAVPSLLSVQDFNHGTLKHSMGMRLDDAPLSLAEPAIHTARDSPLSQNLPAQLL